MVNVGRGKGWSSTNHEIILIREALARAEEESGDLLLWSRISSMLSPRVLFFLRKQAFCEVIQFLSVERDERGSLDATTHVPVVYGSVNTTMEEGRRESKRPASADREEDKRGEEEMEKFYALLENIRAMRDCLRRSRHKRMKKEAAKPVWKPRIGSDGECSFESSALGQFLLLL
ncbi:hypothetical protein C4D60_Mb04t00710 [Musa balbisiana]|uniref:Uncharacterized protein n=1 Tax=Musa balbisiana TaxID=52838 RepID=A0A4S8K8S2_MUSBA|nr:hypothetical protein C4D60_Mb04t00710 [Musa balbisiana]